MIVNAPNTSITQVALNCLIHFNGDFVVTIPGATKANQAQESAGAMGFVLTTDELKMLDLASRSLQ